jgi:hypothetical protein
MVRSLLLSVLALCVAGCDLLGIGTECTLVARSALLIEVVDSASGAPILAGDVEVLVVVTDGSYVDSLRVDGPVGRPTAALPLAEERSGNYRVEVTASGFAPWVVSNVRVQEDECHVLTRELTARLRPTS